MPGDFQPDSSHAGNGRNGVTDRPLQSRVADLLDDVTVGDAATAQVMAPSAQAIATPVVALPTMPDLERGSLPPFLAQGEPMSAAATGHDRHAPVGDEGNGVMASAIVAAMAASAAPIGAEKPAEEVMAAPVSPAEESAPAAPTGPAISIRGRADGLAIEIGKGSWHEILAALEVRLDQSASFFRSASVALDVGVRPVTEAELTELIAVLKTNGMSLGAVRTSAERTFQSALTLGLTATLESADGTPVADAAPAATNATTAAYFVYRGYLRSGHKLQRQEHILVIGDVNPGAEVISQGDVLVWGRLRGVVHAGVGGNQRAIVAALDLEPTQLRIAEVMTIGADPRPGQPGKWFWQRSAHKRPEVARIANGAITLEEWDATRPGGLVSLRRRA